MDLYLKNPENLAYKARAEKYAKITAKTIINSGGFDTASAGQNAFFYDAAEGLLTSVILLIAEYCEPKQRHIVSVFKLIQDLLAPSGVKGRTLFQMLLAHLPDEHKTKWFAGAALNTAEQAMRIYPAKSPAKSNSTVPTAITIFCCRTLTVLFASFIATGMLSRLERIRTTSEVSTATSVPPPMCH